MILTEQLLAEAAMEVDEAMMRGLPEPEECRPEFSRWFEQKMKRVLRRGRHPAVYRVMQRAAAFVLVLFFGFAAVMAVSPTVRASVWGWIREKYESFNRYYFEDRPAADVRNREYYISGLDSDYEVYYDNGDNGARVIVYQNSDGEFVQFIYNTDYTASSFYVEQEGFLVEEVSINGAPGDVYICVSGSESNCIVWGDQETGEMFYISGSFDAEKLVALAESVRLPEEELTRYYISDFPQEYTEVISDFDEEIGKYLGAYRDEEGNMMYFMYSLVPDNSNFYITEEGYDVECVYVSNNTADFYLAKDPSDSNAIIWCDSETNAVFCITAYLNKEELIALAESVCRKSEEPVVEKPADYVLTGLPEGYTEYVENDAPDIYTILYTNADGKPLYFVYSRDPDAANVFLKAEGYVVEEASVHGMDADVYLSSDPEQSSTIIWCDGSTQTMFYISACMDKEELITLAESVRRADGYILTGLPEGSELVEVSETAKNYFSVYFNPEGQIFYFSYGIADGSGVFAVGTEGYDIESVMVNGYHGDLYMGQDPAKNNSIIWGSEDEKLIFYISGPFDRDTMIALAESVEPVG